MNYYDILLAKKLEDDRDPKVEGLSVTANGTYSEEGKVYKPVIVNVAGYGLADMPGGAIASFSDGAALPLNKLKVSIDPVQSGSGDPSPTNIRPISGWDSVGVGVCGKNFYSATLADYSSAQVVGVGLATFYPVKVPYGTYTISTNAPTGYIWAGTDIYDSATLPRVYEGKPNTVTTDIIWVGLLTSDMSSAYAYNIMINQGSTPSSYEPYNGNDFIIQLGDTYYGASLDVVNGVLTLSKILYTYDGSQDEQWNKYNSGSASAYAMTITIPNAIKIPLGIQTIQCNELEPIVNTATWGDYDNFVSMSAGSNTQIMCGIRTITTVEDWKTYLASNPLQVMGILETPIVISVQPTSIKSLEGVNNIFADTGNILEGQYFKSL